MFNVTVKCPKIKFLFPYKFNFTALTKFKINRLATQHTLKWATPKEILNNNNLNLEKNGIICLNLCVPRFFVRTVTSFKILYLHFVVRRWRHVFQGLNSSFRHIFNITKVKNSVDTNLMKNSMFVPVVKGYIYSLSVPFTLVTILNMNLCYIYWYYCVYCW